MNRILKKISTRKNNVVSGRMSVTGRPSFLFEEVLMYKYRFSGPVSEFGRCITEHWEGETTAISKARARANLEYRFKKQHNKYPSAKISLVGDIQTIL